MYCKSLHVGVSARAISLCQPETLILRRSFYNPPRLQPWCQRSIFVWILSHWNIEGHLGLKSIIVSVVSAAKREHADNPTMGAEKLFCLRSLETPMHQITSETVLNVDISWPMAYLGLPQAVISARINSDWLFRPKLKNPPGAKNYAWSHFGQIHPQDISKMKSLKKTVVREVSPDSHLITPELHQVSPEFFFSKKWENAKSSFIFLSSKSFARIGNFARRLFFSTLEVKD